MIKYGMSYYLFDENYKDNQVKIQKYYVLFASIEI